MSKNPPDKRDLVEGKLVQLGMRAAELGINVVFDFGFWGKDERSALRWIAGAVGARSASRLPAELTTRSNAGVITDRSRNDARPDIPHAATSSSSSWRAQFEAPDEGGARGVCEAPPGPTRARDLVGVGLAALAVLA